MVRSLKRSLAQAALLAAASLAVYSTVSIPQAKAYPEPSMVPVSWELDIKTTAPDRVVVDGKTYWYIRYTVTNNTGKDILFTPDFQLISDTGQVVTGNHGIKRNVYEKIKSLYAGTYVESPFEIFGSLKQGDDNARDSIAVFGDVDVDTRNVHVFISGLSGETTEVKDPVTDKVIVLHKTLVFDYDLPGEQIKIDPQPKLKSKRWVMK
jgi:hypothetical protein